MMKASTLFCLYLLLFHFLTAQTKNQVIFDEKSAQNILIGECDKNGLVSFDKWFNNEFATYKIDTETLANIDTSLLNTLKITILMGTWCSDSRRELPRIYKILEYLQYDLNNLELIGVNREKIAPEINTKEYKLEFVPTIIFYYNKYELGRIIESPIESLEKDMFKILNEVKKS